MIDPLCASQLRGTYSVGELSALCELYHRERGRFAYAAVAWAAAHVYDDALPVPLIQWALTPWGHCIGLTEACPDTVPVITLHPMIWTGGRQRQVPGGPRYTLDVIVHELLHLQVGYVRGAGGCGESSHDNPVWAEEVMRLSPRIGLGPVQTAPTRRVHVNGRMLRRTPDGCLSMDELSRWPSSLRPTGYWCLHGAPSPSRTGTPSGSLASIRRPRAFLTHPPIGRAALRYQTAGCHVPRAMADAAVSFTFGLRLPSPAPAPATPRPSTVSQSIALPLLLLNRLQVVGDQHDLTTRDLLSVGRFPFLRGEHLPPHRHVRIAMGAQGLSAVDGADHLVEWKFSARPFGQLR
jgi:hypothetical protein